MKTKIFLSIIIISLLLSASMTPTLARTAKPSGYVIYRIDDIQSSWLPNVQAKLLDKFIHQNTKASLAIIPSEMKDQGQVFNKIKIGIDYKLFEIDAHGWKHVDYSKLDLGAQYSTIAKSKQKLQQMFDIPIQVFIPPYNTFNKNTLQVMVMLGFNVISADKDSMKNTSLGKLSDKQGEINVSQIPETISYMGFKEGKWFKTPNNTITNHVNNDIQKYGYAIITLHPQNFAMMKKGEFIDKLNQKEMDRFVGLMNEIKQENYKSIVFEDVVKMSMEKQRSKSDVLMGRNGY